MLSKKRRSTDICKREISCHHTYERRTRCAGARVSIQGVSARRDHEVAPGAQDPLRDGEECARFKLRDNGMTAQSYPMQIEPIVPRGT
jgi:hypothetical protein